MPCRQLWLAATALLTLAAGAASAESAAVTGDQVTVLQNTVVNILDALVKQGLITKDAADKLVADAQRKADADATAGAAAPGDVRVTYVPQVVQDDITAQVKKDLQVSVVEDVKAAAKAEGWGVPAALPGWIRNSRWSGDVRVRGESTAFASGNEPLSYLDYQAINERGGFSNDEGDFLNTTEDQLRFQVKMSLGAQFDLNPYSMATIRLSTGNDENPVTRNQALGSYERTSPVLLEEAYIRLGTPADWDQHHVAFLAGRFPGPWQSTELMWDNDVRFNGFALQYGWNALAPGQGRGLFASVGVVPLEELELTSDDKWLFISQLGYEFPFTDELQATVAAGWYRYENVTGVVNAENSHLNDFTAPEFIQKGNTLFNIRRDLDDPDSALFALASEFELLQLYGNVSWLIQPDLRLDFFVEGIRNTAYDADDIAARVGGEVAEDADDAWRAEIRIGNPEIRRALAWRAWFGYHYAESDALLDALTDSDFHRGGTDSEGYFIGGDLGLSANTWLRLRYLAADEIDGFGSIGPTGALGIDVVQLDLNAKF